MPFYIEIYRQRKRGDNNAEDNGVPIAVNYEKDQGNRYRGHRMAQCVTPSHASAALSISSLIVHTWSVSPLAIASQP